MAEYFGFKVDESYAGEFNDLVFGVDPKYHKAIAWGLAQLCHWYGDKSYRQIEEWFTAIYGTILMVENDINSTPGQMELNFDDLTEVE